MKRFLKLFPLTLLLCLALALGLTACGGKSYSVTAEYDANAGSVVLSEEGKTSDGKYQEGASVTVTVTPNAGYAVSAFSVNGTAQTLSGSSYTFTVKEDTKIAVTFGEAAYTVTLEKDFEEAMGSASITAPKSGTTYAKDELVTLTVTVNAGYIVDKVTVNGEEFELNEDGQYSFKVKTDAAIKVTLRAIEYYKVTVGAFDEKMGTVNVSPEAGADGTYREGAELTLAVSAKYGYKLLSVKVDGNAVTLDENGKYTFTIQKDTSVEASFEARKPYKVTFFFDTETCSMSYIGENEEGKAGDISLQPNVKTDLYEGETVFTVSPAGGYEIAWVEVNGQEIELSERSFTLDIGEALQDEEGEINVAVFCGFVFTQRDSLAGEYELTDDVWYSFTLEEPAVFEFSATNYVAYAAFYTMTQTDDSTWDVDNEHPVWKFNDDGRSNYAINTFEAGTYMARFSSSTGDGSASSKLTVTELPYLDFEIKNIRVPSYVSLNGQYKLYVGTHYLVLKDKEGKAIDATVTFTTDERGNHINVAFGGKTYFLGITTPAFNPDNPDNPEGPGEGYVPTPADGLIVSLFIVEGETITEGIYFRPDPLPTDVTIAKELAGAYAGTTYDDDEENIPVEGDLIVRGNTIRWGEKEITLLSSLTVCSSLEEIPEKVSVGYCEEKVFFFFAVLYNNVYMIGMMSPDYQNQVTFSPKSDDGSLDPDYWGRWDCGVYTLNITANSVTLTKNGKEIDVTVGTFTRTLDKDGKYTQDYVSFTFEGKSYYVFTIANGRMNLYPTSGSLNASERMIFSAKFTLTVNAPHATVNIVEPKELYELNATVFFTVTPEAGYVVTSVKQNGADVKFEDDLYSFHISGNTEIVVECELQENVAAETSPVAFDDEFIGTWQNGDLRVIIQKNSVALSDGAGNALPHSLRAETYRGRQYNAVVLGGTCYLFLKADGT